jgi:hypothetical protein
MEGAKSGIIHNIHNRHLCGQIVMVWEHGDNRTTKK